MKTSFTVLAFVLGALSGLYNADAQNILEESPSVENLIPGKMKFCMGSYRIGGHWLSEEELQAHVGDAVFYETYVGARKQYIAGAVTMGGGAGLIIAGSVIVDAAGRSGANPSVTNTAVGVAAVCYMVGTLSLMTGIPFLAIGSGRLKWIAGDYNERQAPVSLDFGACPNGVGLCLKF